MEKMKLTIDFSALCKAVNKVGHSDVVYDSTYSVVDRTTSFFESIELFSYLPEGLIWGEDVAIGSITSESGVLEYMGQQVMLYLEDQGQYIHDVLEKGALGGVVHVAECKTLESMKMKGETAAYCVISRMDGKFPVCGIELTSKRVVEGNASLLVCPNCLETLNYKGYLQLRFGQKNTLIKDFNFGEFYKTYSSYFKSFPHREIEDNNNIYSDDWELITSKVRKELNYTCQDCGVYLKKNRHLLQIIHINGIKLDNNSNNLKALCVDCCKKQLNYSDLHSKHSAILHINRLRREQNIFDPMNYQMLEKFADSAVEGLIAKCRKHNLPIAELGISIQHHNQIIDIDLAWERKKIAVLLDKTKVDIFEAQGWSVFSAQQALVDFTLFQKKIR